MRFCPKCGRQRDGDARFCGDCGTEFGDQAASAQAPPAAGLPDATRWDAPADITRMDAPADITKPASPPAESDPFASWFAPDVPGDPAASPTQELSYPPPQQASTYQSPQPQPQPQVSTPAPSRSSNGKKAAFTLVAIAVVLGAGIGAYTLVSMLGKHSTGQSSAGSAKASAAATGSASPASSSSPSAPQSATPTAKPSPRLVSLASGLASNPAEPRVETVLTHYFQGINTHDYTLYASALDAQERASQPKSTFDSGYATTSDSGITLTAIADTGNGSLTATVTFTSHQAPANSVDKKPCNKWTLNLYLIPGGAGYLISQAPPGYQPVYSDC